MFEFTSSPLKFNADHPPFKLKRFQLIKKIKPSSVKKADLNLTVNRISILFNEYGKFNIKFYIFMNYLFNC
ncbi:hypothetical protein A9P44_08935 [Paenibacillus polymyxa]|nr:hypothetical protein A9P44_08935 [Paenibacillus polymyxa]